MRLPRNLQLCVACTIQRSAVYKNKSALLTVLIQSLIPATEDSDGGEPCGVQERSTYTFRIRRVAVCAVSERNRVRDARARHDCLFVFLFVFAARKLPLLRESMNLVAFEKPSRRVRSHGR